MNNVATKDALQQDDWWEQLPKKVQVAIDEAIADLDKGNGIPHEEVMKKYSRWLER